MQISNEFLKYAYLLDEDNTMYSNKVFIDLMYYITKMNKIKTKSYVIRTAGMMLQHIFSWHFSYMKKGMPTKYRYNINGTLVNTVKKDYKDWWEILRISDVEVTSANKLLTQIIQLINISEYEKENQKGKLLETASEVHTSFDKSFDKNSDYGILKLKDNFKEDNISLVNIVVMRIKQKDSNVQKACNCYILNWNVFELFLNKLTEIVSEVYKDKVGKVEELNKITSKNYLKKHRNRAILETGVALETEGLEVVQTHLSTLLTGTSEEEVSATLETGIAKGTLETRIAKGTLETKIAKATLVSKIANKSVNTYTGITTVSTSQEEQKNISTLSEEEMLEVFKKDNLSVISILKNKLTETTYNTWIDTCVPKAYLDKDVIIIPFQNDFSKEVVKSRYSELINSTYKLISNYKSYEIKYEVIKN